MSTYYHLDLDLPLRAGVSAEEAERVALQALDVISWRPDERDAWATCTIICEGALFEVPEVGHGPQVVDGRLRASMFMENIYREVGDRHDDGGDDPRTRIAVFLEEVGALTDAPPGSIVGAVGSESSEALGPVLMTSKGLRLCYSTAADPGRGYSDWMSEFPGNQPVTFVPPALITVEDDCNCRVDEKGLLAHFAPIDGTATVVEPTAASDDPPPRELSAQTQARIAAGVERFVRGALHQAYAPPPPPPAPRPPRPKAVVEKLRLDQCEKGDLLRIPYSPNASWKSIGAIVLEKIKPLPKGNVQIKFRSRWGTRPTIQKADVPGHVLVERERPMVEADADRADVAPVPATAEHEGVVYQATHPDVDPVEAVLKAALSAVPVGASFLGEFASLYRERDVLPPGRSGPPGDITDLLAGLARRR